MEEEDHDKRSGSTFRWSKRSKCVEAEDHDNHQKSDVTCQGIKVKGSKLDQDRRVWIGSDGEQGIILQWFNLYLHSRRYADVCTLCNHGNG